MAFTRPRARILELSTTPGNGPYALAGAADSSYNRFSAFMSVGDVTHVTVVEPGVAFWTGLATYSAVNQITLTDVEETKGAFGAGTKEIFAAPLASTSAYPRDVSGMAVTAGTASAYTIASWRGYDTLAHLDGNVIAFTPHATNAQSATLAVDGLAAKPLRFAPGVNVQSGVLIQGTPYTALYSNADGAFYLHMIGGNPYGIPLAGGIEYWGDDLPSSAYAFPAGQAISRTLYAALWSKIGARFGAGDGATTFNLPDKRGRVSVAADNMGGVGQAFRINNILGNPVGSVGGEQQHQLAVGELPGITSAVTVNVNVSGQATRNDVIVGSHGLVGVTGGGAFFVEGGNLSNIGGFNTPGALGFTGSGSGNGFAQSNDTNGQAHNNVQPSIVCNYLMRII